MQPSSPQRPYSGGYGVAYNMGPASPQGSPVRRGPHQLPPTPSPQRTAPRRYSGGGGPMRSPPRHAHGPSSPSQGHHGSPARRFRIANPDPPSPHRTAGGNNGGFALKPTHTLNQQRHSYTGTSFSAIPPPNDPFTDSAPSQSRLENEQSVWETSSGEEGQKLLPGKGSNPKLRPSKSSEILRKLGTNKRDQHQSLGDGEDPDEQLRLPPDHGRIGVRSPSGAATSLATPPTPASTWTLGKEHLTGEFPAPPVDRLRMPNPNFRRDLASSGNPSPQTSQETFVTAEERYASSNESNQSSASGSTQSGAPRGTPHRKGSVPYPAEASPAKRGNARNEAYPQRHSHNEALLAAETGGMIMLSDNHRYSAGESPGHSMQPLGPAAGAPEYPPNHRRSHRQSMPVFPNVNYGRPAGNAPSHFRPPGAGSPAHYRHSAGSQFDGFYQQPSSSNSSTRPDFSRPRDEIPNLTPNSSASDEEPPLRRHVRSNSDGIALLNRQGTLFHPASSTERASLELDVMLGKPKSRRLSANALLPLPEASSKDKVRLEASKKGRARVELDVVIERECVVEGAELRGRLEVVVRGGKRSDGLRVGAGKIRVLGYEEVEGKAGTRHIFYQYGHVLPVFQNLREGPRSSLFDDEGDSEGFHLANEGTHSIPFSMQLPVGGGAKGAFNSPAGKGPNVRYVVVGSIKLHIPKTGKRAIAHFYRPIVLLPYFNPAVVLAPARAPIVQSTEGGLGWSMGGEKGKVAMQVALGRQIWVAGQRIWCEVGVRNNSNKKINRIALAIIQNVNTFGAPGAKGCKTGDAFESTERKKVSEELTEADFMDLGSGHITGKSWWTGLEPGESNRWDMSVPIPNGMVSIPRSRFVEVNYTLRVTVNNSIFVDVPIELINFLSVDPPPMPSDTRRQGRLPVAPPAAVSMPTTLYSAVPEPPMPQQHLQYFQPVPVQEVSPRTSEPSDRDTSPTLGVQQPQMGYTLEQLRSDSSQAARHSSTTLDLNALIMHGQQEQEAEVLPPADATSDLMPRALSPESKYSTVQGDRRLPVSAVSSVNGMRHLDSFSDVDEMGNHYAAEEQKRDARDQLIANIERKSQDEERGEELIDRVETASVHSLILNPEEQRTYLPAAEPTGVAYEIDAATEVGSVVADDPETDNDRTPMASPKASPRQAPRALPEPPAQRFVLDPEPPSRSAYLHHISEEEEPLSDDMLDEMMSSNHDHEGSHLQSLGDEEDDDLMVDNDADTTPRVSVVEPQGRPSLEERLRACIKDSPTKAGSTGAKPLSNSSAVTPPDDRPMSVDYTEPLDVEDLALNDDEDVGYDAEMSETHSHAGSPPKMTFAKYIANSVPFNLSRRANPPPNLTSSSGTDLNAGLASYRKLAFEEGPPLASPSSATFGTAPVSPRYHDTRNLGGIANSAAYDDPEPSQLERDHEHRDLASMAQSKLERDHERRDLAGMAGDLSPPRPFAHSPRSGQGSSVGSFHTAQDGDVPPLARSDGSGTSSEGAPDSPALHPQPVYNTPLPDPPYQRGPTVPERFRPAPPMSDDSHDGLSVVSSAHDSAMLPAVRARVAQFESREEALKKFSVDQRVGLNDYSQYPPLSPASTGTSTSASGRRSYTTALALGKSPRALPSPSSPPFAFDRQYDGDLSNSAARLLNRTLSTRSQESDSTADVEHSLSRSPVLGPRGPRPPSRQSTQPSPSKPNPYALHDTISSRLHDTVNSRYTESVYSMESGETADFGPPRMPVDSNSLRRSPAQMPTQELRVPDVRSETGHFEDVEEELVSDGASFGSTGWQGGSARLPALRYTVRPV